MPDFTYEAVAGSGQRSNGTLTAGSEREVMTLLEGRGLFPVRILPAKSAAQKRRWGNRVRPRYMARLYSQLADLLHSGVPLLRSLDILQRQSSNPILSEVIRDVRARVAEGTGLAEAMATHPNAFNELAVSMVRAGQEGGFLEDVLKRIADFTEHQEDLKGKVVGALAYPAFLSFFGSIILFVLIVFFVPMFEPMFQKLDEKGELPWLTRALLGVSHTVLSWRGLVLFLGLVGSIFWFRRWASTEKGRLRLDRLRLRLPGAGEIYLQLAISRFTRILGTLLHNGIPILRALEIAKDSTGNRVLTQSIEEAAENITAGKSLAQPLAASKHFPRDVVEMVAVGEESNNLENVLLNIADSMEKQTTRKLDLLVRLLEPVMLLVMAVVALLVVGALLWPVFKMGSTVK